MKKLAAEALPVDKSPAGDWRSPEPEEEPERATFPQRLADALGLMAEAL